MSLPETLALTSISATAWNFTKLETGSYYSPSGSVDSPYRMKFTNKVNSDSNIGGPSKYEVWLTQTRTASASIVLPQQPSGKEPAPYRDSVCRIRTLIECPFGSSSFGFFSEADLRLLLELNGSLWRNGTYIDQIIRGER